LGARQIPHHLRFAMQAQPADSDAAYADYVPPPPAHASALDGFASPEPPGSPGGVATGGASGAGPLVYCKLPDDIESRHVLLLDPILPGGFSAVRAIEALLVRCACPPGSPVGPQ
jgi:Uracil phosphoribosyltransferase